MRNTILTILIILVGLIGVLLSLVQIYASPDYISYPLNGSIIYLGTAVFLFAFMHNLNSNVFVILKWINIIFVLGYIVLGLLLALICLYALENDQVESLASALFFLSSMLTGSGIFFSLKKMRTEENK